MSDFLNSFRPPLAALILLTGVPCLTVLADTPPAKDIPEAIGSALYQRARKQPVEAAERLKLNADILAEARKALAEHADVPQTAPLREILVRRIMLPAAERIYAAAPTAENRQQFKQLARDVVATQVYDGHLIVPEKVRAAESLARLEIYSAPRAKPQDAAKHIRALVTAFPLEARTTNAAEFHGQALVYATHLACETGETALADEYSKVIGERFLATRGALDALARAGHPAVFSGEMTTLDGRKLKFPEDARGKVVLLDFWATWCVPCVASMPHVKELVEKYKDREVLVVGVSCDVPSKDETPEENRKKVAAFIAKHGYSWTHTYAGEWPPLAVKYGVSSIPTVFLLDQEGRIVTASARGREEGLIDKTLARKSERNNPQVDKSLSTK